MKAVSKFLAGGVAMAALASAAPAAAQYYPGYGQPNVVGQVINQILGGGSGYGVNSQAAVQRCAAAVEQRVNALYNRGYNSGYAGGYSGYGGYGSNQGYSGYAQPTARVLGVTSVERRSNNGLRVRGTATARAQVVGYGGYNGGYGGYGGYGAQGAYSPYGGQGGYSPYGGYGGYAPQQQQGELTFRCNVDYRGYVTSVDIDRNRYAYSGYRNY